jgi:tRNA(Ile)-lysidine synthase
LLHALARIRADQDAAQPGRADFELSAIHIHHGLNPKADTWQQHCQRVCSQLQVGFQSARIEVTKQRRQSLEAEARQARYSKLIELTPPHSTIVLGQHQDDQLETVLLQLKRGAGPKGLSGMARLGVSKHEGAQGVSFFRPLLDCSQQQILAYARQHDLSWQEDDSNLDTQFERNFLRHRIIPLLIDRWPQVANSVARSAQLCAEQEQLLHEVCQQKLAGLCAPDNSLDIGQLQLLSEAWQRQLVRSWLAQQDVQSPSQAILEQLLRQVVTAGDDANPLIQWLSWQCRRFHQRLYLLPLSADLAGTHLVFTEEKALLLPQGLGRLRLIAGNLAGNQAADTLTFVGEIDQLQVRFGGYGDKFKPAHSAHSKPLKQWFKLWQIPPWQRDKVAIILHLNNVIGLVVKGELIASQLSPLASGQTLNVIYSADLTSKSG